MEGQAFEVSGGRDTREYYDSRQVLEGQSLGIDKAAWLARLFLG